MLAHLFHIRLEAAHGIEVGELLADAVAAARDLAQAAPGGGTGFEHLVDSSQRHGVALGHDPAGIGDLDVGAPLVQLAHDHGDTLQHVHWLEPGNDPGDAVILGQEAVRLRPDDGGHMPWQNERIQLQRWIVDDDLQRPRHVFMGTVHGEVCEPHGARPLDGHGHQGRGGFEAHADENDLPIRVLLRQAQSVQRRVDDLHRAPRRLLGQQTGGGAGHAGHIAEGGDGHLRHASQRNHLVDVVVARHAHGAPRAGGEAHPLGHKAANAVARDGHRVGAAHFHQRRGLWGQRLNGLDEPPRQRRIFECLQFLLHGVHSCNHSFKGVEYGQAECPWHRARLLHITPINVMKSRSSYARGGFFIAALP